MLKQSDNNLNIRSDVVLAQYGAGVSGVKVRANQMKVNKKRFKHKYVLKSKECKQKDVLTFAQ